MTYPHEQPIHKQLVRIGVTCKRGQTVNLLDTQIGLVAAGLGIAVIPSFGVLASPDRKVRITQLDPGDPGVSDGMRRPVSDGML